jgi:hypothetical protein
VLGYLTLTLAQSVPFVWWRRVPLLAAGLAATVLAIRTGLGQNPYSAAAATAAGAFGLGASGHRRTRLIARILTAAAVTAAALVLLTSDGFRAQALPLALLATALGMGEVTAANRDAAAAAARLAHDSAARGPPGCRYGSRSPVSPARCRRPWSWRPTGWSRNR